MSLSLRAYPSCQIVRTPFDVLDAALEASIRELNFLQLACKRTEHTRGSVVYAVRGRFQWECWGVVGSINLRMLGKDDLGRDETELLIAPSHYPQPDMSNPTWAAEMQETRRQIDEAYEAFLKATIVALLRNLTRGERIRAAAQVVNAQPTPSGAVRDLMPQQEQETTRGAASLLERETVSTLFDGDFTKYPEELFRIAFKVAQDLNEEAERSELPFSSGIAGIDVPPDMLRGRRQMTRIRIAEAPNCRQSEDGAITTDDTCLIGYVSIQPKTDGGGRVTIEHCGKPGPIRSEMNLNVDKEPQDRPACIRIISAEGFDRAQWFENFTYRFLLQADGKRRADDWQRAKGHTDEQPRTGATPLASKFFITHSSADLDFARRLCGDLRTNGLDGFFDAYSIKPGDKIPAEIARGLDACDTYVPILSYAALKSPWCEEEINAAMVLSNSPSRNGRPRIIPILVEDCQDAIPIFLRTRLYIKFPGRYDAALKELLTVHTQGRP